MRVALVWNAPIGLVEITTRYEPYVEGLRSLGADVITVCPTGTEEGYPYPVRCFIEEREMIDPAFWRHLGCQVVVMITWHRMTDILRAARSAGVKVLAIGESDGQLSPWYHPWPTFRFMTFSRTTWRSRLGAAKHWAIRFLLWAGREHRALFENTAAADVYTLAGRGPVDEFRRLLVRGGAPDLADRLAWLPYPIPSAFCTGPVPPDRPNRVIAVGRWDAAQKDPGLLAATISRVTVRRPIEVWVVGPGGERFSGLARGNGRFRVLGPQPRDSVREMMLGCRAVLISSRWEGTPIVANEMLALGGTVIGTPIPGIRWIVADGRFGRVSRSHTSAALADAVEAEMAAWDRGERDSVTIAAHWRRHVSPPAVARRMLDLLKQQPTDEAASQVGAAG